MTSAGGQSVLPALGLFVASAHSACPCEAHFIEYILCNSPDQDQRVGFPFPISWRTFLAVGAILSLSFLFLTYITKTTILVKLLPWMLTGLIVFTCSLPLPFPHFYCPFLYVPPTSSFIVGTISCTTTTMKSSLATQTHIDPSFHSLTNIYGSLLECRHYAKCWWTSDKQEKSVFSLSGEIE